MISDEEFKARLALGHNRARGALPYKKRKDDVTRRECAMPRCGSVMYHNEGGNLPLICNNHGPARQTVHQGGSKLALQRQADRAYQTASAEDDRAAFLAAAKAKYGR